LDNAEILAPHLATFSGPFLKYIDTVDYTQEKATATKGFLVVVNANPQAMEKDLTTLFSVIARYRKYLHPAMTDLTNDLTQIFQHTLNVYKGLIPDFNAFLTTQMSIQDANALRETYGL